MTKTNELLEQWALVSKQAFNVHHALRVGDEMAAQLNQLQGELNTQRALVQQLGKPVQVPYGWQLVPVEATDTMIEAAWESDAADYVGEHKRIHQLGPAWCAMLAAAPQPPAQEDARVCSVCEGSPKGINVPCWACGCNKAQQPASEPVDNIQFALGRLEILASDPDLSTMAHNLVMEDRAALRKGG